MYSLQNFIETKIFQVTVKLQEQVNHFVIND